MYIRDRQLSSSYESRRCCHSSRGAKIISLRMLSTYAAWRPFQTDRTTCNQAKSVVILQPGKHHEPRSSNHRSYPASSRRIYRRQTVARTFVRQRSLLCEAAASYRVGHLFNPEAMNGKSKPGRPHLADPRAHSYNFKLNEEREYPFLPDACEDRTGTQPQLGYR